MIFACSLKGISDHVCFVLTNKILEVFDENVFVKKLQSIFFRERKKENSLP